MSLQLGPVCLAQLGGDAGPDLDREYEIAKGMR